MFALSPDEQRKNLEEFRRKSKLLLTNQERDFLHDILKQYQTYRDVRRLVVCLCGALDSPQKLDLLREIRFLIPLSHQPEFDRMAPYGRMLHPIYPEGVTPEKQLPPGGGGRRRMAAGEGRRSHDGLDGK